MIKFAFDPPPYWDFYGVESLLERKYFTLSLFSCLVSPLIGVLAVFFSLRLDQAIRDRQKLQAVERMNMVQILLMASGAVGVLTYLIIFGCYMVITSHNA